MKEMGNPEMDAHSALVFTNLVQALSGLKADEVIPALFIPARDLMVVIHHELVVEGAIEELKKDEHFGKLCLADAESLGRAVESITKLADGNYPGEWQVDELRRLSIQMAAHCLESSGGWIRDWREEQLARRTDDFESLPVDRTCAGDRIPIG